jgi:hypothetical protein
VKRGGRREAALSAMLAVLVSLQAPNATTAGTIDLAYGLAVARNQAKPDEDRCPGFIVSILSGPFGALAQCEEVGGTLVAAKNASIRAIDVNGDGQPEYLFALDADFACEGAASIFSCGSLGCPLVLFERTDGAWAAIGALDASADQSIVVAPADGTTNHRQLRVGCPGQDPCDESIEYGWTGTGYEQLGRQVRGFWVDVVNSPHGLRELVSETPVLATPSATGKVLGRYVAGTEVAIIGKACGAPYYYVSPCNACENGFVEKSAVRAE